MDATVLTRRFVGAQKRIAFESAFARKESLCRREIVPAEEPLLVRAAIALGGMHPFHMHPMLNVSSLEHWCSPRVQGGPPTRLN